MSFSRPHLGPHAHQSERSAGKKRVTVNEARGTRRGRHICQTTTARNGSITVLYIHSFALDCNLFVTHSLSKQRNETLEKMSDAWTVDSWNTHQTSATVPLIYNEETKKYACPKHPSCAYDTPHLYCEQCEADFQAQRQALQEKQASVRQQLQELPQQSLADLQTALQQWKPPSSENSHPSALPPRHPKSPTANPPAPPFVNPPTPAMTPPLAPSSLDALTMQLQRMQSMQDWMLVQKEQECLTLKQELENARLQIQELRVENALLTEKLSQQEERMQQELKLIKLAAWQQQQHLQQNQQHVQPPQNQQQFQPPQQQRWSGYPNTATNPANGKAPVASNTAYSNNTFSLPPNKNKKKNLVGTTRFKNVSTSPVPNASQHSTVQAVVAKLNNANASTAATSNTVKQSPIYHSSNVPPTNVTKQPSTFPNNNTNQRVTSPEIINGSGMTSAHDAENANLPDLRPDFESSMETRNHTDSPDVPKSLVIDKKSQSSLHKRTPSNISDFGMEDAMETWHFKNSQEMENARKELELEQSLDETYDADLYMKGESSEAVVESEPVKQEVVSIRPARSPPRNELPPKRRAGGVSFPDDNASQAQTVASPTFGDDRQNVVNKSILDPYGDRGFYTGVILRSTGMPHGSGKMLYQEDQRTYDGEWRHGRWHGFGQATFANGDEYRGEYRFDQRHGRGKYSWNDGRVYDGMFREDKRHGPGTFMWPDGAIYTGEFCNGQREGQGKYTFADGGCYEGSWKDGRYSGYGVCAWEDGRCYKGEWLNGMAHGKGVETFADGTVRHDGLWVEDEPVLN
jgi:hypothetical protein